MALVQVCNERLMSVSILRTAGVFTICTGTYGSGARTGIGITRPAHRVILSVLRTAPAASGAVVPGSTRTYNARSADRLRLVPAFSLYNLGIRLSLRPASK